MAEDRVRSRVHPLSEVGRDAGGEGNGRGGGRRWRSGVGGGREGGAGALWRPGVEVGKEVKGARRRAPFLGW